MHVIRPKSTKGSTRPKVTEVHTADKLPHENHLRLPRPPSHPPRPAPTPSHRFDSSPSLHPFLKPSDPSSVPEKTLDIRVLSLNKYRVLPSIEKRSEDEASSADTEDTSSRTRRHSSHLLERVPEMDRTSSGNVRTSSWSRERETGILLALRTPCGQRLECQFRPTDTLWDVIATVEGKSGNRYEHVLIETMEVPRRSFTDLSMTLSQCGIMNKSVLCISLKDES